MGILTPQIVNLSPKAHSHTFLSISESAGFVLSLHSGRHSLPASSGIYAGFKNHPEIQTNEKLYYAALVLLLERGRPVTEWVLSGSMGPPPVEPPAFEIHVQQFGYKTRVLTTVPDEYGRL